MTTSFIIIKTVAYVYKLGWKFFIGTEEAQNGVHSNIIGGKHKEATDTVKTYTTTDNRKARVLYCVTS